MLAPRSALPLAASLSLALAAGCGDESGETATTVDLATLREDLIGTSWVVMAYRVDGDRAVVECDKPGVSIGAVWDFTDTRSQGDLMVQIPPCQSPVLFNGFALEDDVLEVLLHEDGRVDGDVVSTLRYRVVQLDAGALVVEGVTDFLVGHRLELAPFGSTGGTTEGGDVQLCWERNDPNVFFSCRTDGCDVDGKRSAGGYPSTDACAEGLERALANWQQNGAIGDPEHP